MAAVRVEQVEVRAAEPCCPPGQCRYRPDRVSRLLAIVEDLREANLDISTNARSVLRPARGYEGGDVRTPPHDFDEAEPALMLADVLRAVRSARSALDDLPTALCRYARQSSPPVLDRGPADAPPEVWLGVAQAIALTGVSRAWFYRKISESRVRRRFVLSRSGRLQPRYAASDIERLRQRLARPAVDDLADQGVDSRVEDRAQVGARSL